MGKQLVLEFPDAKSRQDFIAWFLDGNGEQDFYDSQQARDRPTMLAAPPQGKDTWDWEEPEVETATMSMVVVDTSEPHDDSSEDEDIGLRTHFSSEE